MDENYEKLENRFDRLEAWHEAELAVAKSKAEASAKRNTRIQLGLSIVSTLTMLVNLYTTFKSS